MDYKKETTHSDETSRTINLSSREDNSKKASPSIVYSSAPETSGTSLSFRFIGKNKQNSFLSN